MTFQGNRAAYKLWKGVQTFGTCVHVACSVCMPLINMRLAFPQGVPIGPTVPSGPIPPIGPLCPLCAHVRKIFLRLHPGMYPGCTSCQLTLPVFKNGHIGHQMGARKVLNRHVPTRVPTNENSSRMIAGVFIGGMAWAQLRNVRNCCHFIGAHVGTLGPMGPLGHTWAHLGTLEHT